jgi:hypothetical protein
MSDKNRSNPTPTPQPRQAPPVDRKVITPIVPQRPTQIPGGGQHGYVPPPPPPPKRTEQK